MNIRDDIQESIQHKAQEISEAYRVRNLLPETVLGKSGFLLVGNPNGSYKTIVHVLSNDIAADARELLSLVGKWDKSFNGDSMEVRGEPKEGNFILKVSGKLPETCKVEVVDTEVTVPEHTEVKRSYRLIGDCLPLTQGLPSAEDLDRVEEERAIADATGDDSEPTGPDDDNLVKMEMDRMENEGVPF
jgi:hypothetical protein